MQITSVSVERVFSKSSRILQDDRLSLGFEVIEHLSKCVDNLELTRKALELITFP